MLAGGRRYLEGIADHVRKASPIEKQFDRLHKIGVALTELLDLSRELYEEHPEVNPFLKEENAATDARGASPADDDDRADP
jgi:hypothetical protein